MNNKGTLSPSEELTEPGRLFLLALSSSYFVTQIPLLIIALLLVNIGETFRLPVGVVGQVETVASLFGMVSAVLCAAWSVRYHHKSLLLVGLVIFGISAVGCFFAYNFIMLLIFYAIVGVGYSIIEPMLYTLVADHLPSEKHSSAIGWLLTGNALVGLICPPVVGLIARISGWRWAFLGIMLPSTLLGVILVFKAVPSSDRGAQFTKGQGNYWAGFNEVITNRSATACLIGTIFALTAWQVIIVYSMSFLRERLSVSLELASILIVGFASGFLLGSQVGGRMANWLGVKPLTVFSTFFISVSIILFMNTSNLWLALIIIYTCSLSGGIRFTTANSLSLGQVPKFYGTMMSLNTLAIWIGAAIGTGLGGLFLVRADYGLVGLIFGILSLVSAFIFNFLVIDPTRINEPNS